MLNFSQGNFLLETTTVNIQWMMTENRRGVSTAHRTACLLTDLAAVVTQPTSSQAPDQLLLLLLQASTHDEFMLAISSNGINFRCMLCV